MNQPFTFQGTIEAGSGGGAFVRVPFDVEEAFGKKRVKIKASIDTEIYRGLLVRMGGPFHMLLILKSIREKLGKDVGQTVAVVLEEDTDPREVVVPEDLDAALQQVSRAQSFFSSLSYTHKKEYVAWINEAKRAETRAMRIQKTITMLESGQRGHS